MALKQYIVNVNGIDHIMQFSEQAARRMGLEPAAAPEEKAAPAPANKARKPRSAKAEPKAKAEPAADSDDSEW